MRQADINQIINRDKMTAVQIKVIILCWLINMLDGFDILSISYTAPAIAEEWALTPEKLGIVFSASLVGMMLGAMFVAPLADRIGRRRLIMACLTLIACAMSSAAWVSSVNQLMLVRAITGLGIGGMLASINTLVAEYSPDKNRNLMIGFLHLGYSLGAALGGVLAAAIMAEYGWRTVFMVGGVATVVMMTVVVFMLPESLHFLLAQQPKNALPRVNHILAKLGEPCITTLNHSSQPSSSNGFKALLSGRLRSQSLYLWLCFFMSMLTLYFLLSWTPKILTQAGLPLDKAIYAGVALNVGGGIGMLCLGYISRTMGLSQMIRVFFVLGALSMGLFASLSSQVYLSLLVTFFMGFFIMGGFIGLYSVAARLYPTQLRNTGVGWGIGVGRLGAILGPYLAGILMTLEWQQAHYFLILAIPLVIAAMTVSSLQTSQLQPAMDNRR